MATTARAIQLLQQYVDLTLAEVSQLNSIIDQVEAIDPAAPDALAQLTALSTRYNQEKDRLNAQRDSVYQEFLAEFNGLTNAEKVIVRQSSAWAAYEAVGDPDAALGARLQSVFTNKNNAILEASAVPDAQEEAAAQPNPEESVVTIAVEQDQFAFQGRKDWRVRLSLSEDPSVNYLYKSNEPGILSPLIATDGVLFPYTPQINVTYAANYNPAEIVHSNYKQYQYSSSSVDSVTLTCDFTAQDTYEANYLLAVIHFFRSMTKMFYGQDENPRRGTPPPLCYLFGMGNYQFAAHPLAISGFTYNLPNNVDYIKTISPSVAGVTLQPATKDIDNTRQSRLDGTNAAPGGRRPPPNINIFQNPGEDGTVSWVPTKIQLSITCVPMMSRNQISNVFSLKDYASGKLLNGIGKQGGGFW